jgi:hypothetical protein
MSCLWGEAGREVVGVVFGGVDKGVACSTNGSTYAMVFTIVAGVAVCEVLGFATLGPLGRSHAHLLEFLKLALTALGGGDIEAPATVPAWSLLLKPKMACFGLRREEMGFVGLGVREFSVEEDGGERLWNVQGCEYFGAWSS